MTLPDRHVERLPEGVDYRLVVLARAVVRNYLGERGAYLGIRQHCYELGM